VIVATPGRLIDHLEKQNVVFDEIEVLVLDYLNSVPLAAAPGYGEVNGIGNGLNAWFGIELDDAVAALSNLAATPEAERVAKHVLALICAARAPSYYLRTNPLALEARVDYYRSSRRATRGPLPSRRRRFRSRSRVGT
jgi:hypothetical protein